MKGKKNTRWTKLDNAAKIFPCTTKKQDTKVFRFVCELKEDVAEDKLQAALDMTLKEFPFFEAVLRRGLFWYYFEDSARKAVVRKEDRPPCGPLYDKNKKGLLFRVSYYKKRINLEVYHAVTDGTGALNFLRTLVYHYIMLAHKEELQGLTLQLDYDASSTQRMDDSFDRYYAAKREKRDEKQVEKKEGKDGQERKLSGISGAYRFRGQRLPDYRIKVIRGTLPVDALKKAVKSYKTTITIFLTALIISSIGELMTVRDRRKLVGIVVPVNLRHYFKSESARNFFGTIDVWYDFERRSGEFEDIMAQVEECFQTELTKEKMEERVHQYGALERNPAARVVPLVIKDFFMNLGYEYTDRKYTFSISNIGAVSMPKEFEKYIHLFDVFISTRKCQACICSYGGKLTISFTSPFVSAELEKIFFRKLTGMGIPVEIATNHYEEE
jgi:NRPS condensation-like uncharacterized protein